VGPAGGGRLASRTRGLVKKPSRREAPPQPRAATPPPAAAPLPASGVGLLLDKLTSILPLLGLLVVSLFSLRRLDDFDTWWHMASGRWILQNHTVPHVDTLSFTVPTNEWINLQWLYDLLLVLLWNIGGANILVLASVACFVGTFALLSRHLGRHVGAVTSTLLLVWVAMTVSERFLIRPEMASFPLLAAVQFVLTDGRTNPRRLRWLVPLMVLWVNMHSLFILGMGAIALAIGASLVAELPLLPGGWRRDTAWPAEARRQLLRWGPAALLATLFNPYFVRAWLFPIELMTRIDGSNPVYGAIGEFRPPFSGYFPTFAIGSYQAFVFAFLGLAVVAGLLRAFAPPPPRESGGGRPDAATAGSQGFDLGALAFAAALAWLSLLARRNVGIFAIGAVPFVGACLGIVLARLPRKWTAPSAAGVRAASVALALGVLPVSAAVLTNSWYATTGETHEFGLGVLESNFQFRAIEFFREQKLPGPLYNDMTAGGYLTWDDPTGMGVYVDGRLEVYDTPFFGSYLSNMSKPDAWKKDADARGIQSAMVFHRWGNRHGFIRMLMSTPDWRLVYYDETVATFVRTGGANDDRIEAARTAFSATWRDRTEKAMSGPRPTFPWQWSIGRYTGQLAYARVLETVGDQNGALKWFQQAIELGLPRDYNVDARQRAAQYLASAGQYAQARMQLEKAAEADPSNEATRNMLARLDAISK